jgi:hypothetical protein
MSKSQTSHLIKYYKNKRNNLKFYENEKTYQETPHDKRSRNHHQKSANITTYNEAYLTRNNSQNHIANLNPMETLIHNYLSEQNLEQTDRPKAIFHPAVDVSKKFFLNSALFNVNLRLN